MSNESGPFVVVFAGAGASRAVASEHYPTTVEFFSQLPGDIVHHPLFVYVMKYLESRSEIRSIDIEVVLGVLQVLDSQLDAIRMNSHLLGWLMEGGRLLNWKGPQASFDNVREAANQVNPELRSMISNINTRVYDLYRRRPKLEELEQNWFPLLRRLARMGAHVELVTTNYDVVLEDSLWPSRGTNAQVDSGWRGDTYRYLDQGLWARRPDSTNSGLLTKLHGSLNWTRDGTEVLISTPQFHGSHERHAIIYPGFKGRPSQEPFISMHRYFSDSLQVADIVLFIGFAFRDEYINEISERSINPGAQIVVINPAGCPELPWLASKNALAIDSGFDAKSVETAFDFIDAHLRRGTSLEP